MPATYQELYGDLSPLPNDILVHSMEQGDKITRGGIILRDDNGKDHGIRPRWCQVYKIGANVDEVKAGEWVLVEHGRWTFGINVYNQGEENPPLYVQKIDRAAILVVSGEKPTL